MKKISCNTYGSGRKNPEKFCLGIKLLKSWEYKDIVSCAIPFQNLNQMDYNMLIYNYRMTTVESLDFKLIKIILSLKI